MNNFEEYDLNNDRENLMAYIPSIDNVPIVGKKIEHDKNRIVIYSPEQMRQEVNKNLNRGIMHHASMLRSKVFLTNGGGTPFFEGYISHMEQRVSGRETYDFFSDVMQVRTEIRIELIGTT